MKMLNKDKISEKKGEILNQLAEALRENNEDGIKNAMDSFQQFMTDTVMNEAKSIVGSVDSAVLAQRGVRQLTSAENKFYTNIITKARNEIAAGSVIAGIGEVLPDTVIDSIFDTIRTTHPLLSAINFQNTSAITKIVVNKMSGQTATWDELNSPITKRLEGAIDVISLTLCKLSAYMWVTMDMLDLGPAWVDRYTRETLAEALATQLEVGIADGNGLRQPIGFTRNFKGALDPVTGYPRKEAIAISDLGKDTYGILLSALSTDGNSGNPRAISEVILVCNPADYFTKIMPATTVLSPNGVYVNNVFPFPTNVIQSVGIEAGHAVIGLADRYFMGMGSPKEGRLEYSDEYKFIEDLRTYKIKMHGMGTPLDINAFLYLDISNVKDVLPAFETVTSSKTAALTALSAGFDLSPAFDRDVTSYSATATSASSVVFAIPKDGDSEVTIKNGNTAVANGSSVTWANNSVSNLTVTVKSGGAEKTYTVAVTRGTPA